MEFSVKHGQARKQKTACLIVGVHAGRTLSERAADLDKASRGALTRLVQRGDVSGKVGEALMVPEVGGIDAERVLLLGVGKREGVSAEEYQKLISKAAETLKAASLRSGMSSLLDVTVKGRDLRWVVDQHVSIFAAQAYKYTEFKSKPDGHGLTRLALLVDEKSMTDVRAALAVARGKVTGTNLLKDLANRPANHCTLREARHG